MLRPGRFSCERVYVHVTLLLIVIDRINNYNARRCNQIHQPHSQEAETCKELHTLLTLFSVKNKYFWRKKQQQKRIITFYIQLNI